MCVDGLGYVYVCESYAVLDQCDEPLSLFVLYVCAYGGVVGYFMCLSFRCEFCFLYCDDAVYVDLKYDVVFVLGLIVVCEWVGGGLFVIGSGVVCPWCCCYVLCWCMLLLSTHSHDPC